VVGFELTVSRGGLYRALARLADRAAPTYAGLVDAVRQSPVNTMDETGWKVGGRLQWVHVAVSAQVTVYAILPGRGYAQSVVLVGAAYARVLVHDGWAPYYQFQLAFHQSCVNHLLRRCREMAQIASPPAAVFPRAVQQLLQASLVLRDRYARGEMSEHGLRVATGRLEAAWTGRWQPAAGIRRIGGWRAIPTMNARGCSASCTVPAWMRPPMRRRERCAA